MKCPPTASRKSLRVGSSSCCTSGAHSGKFSSSFRGTAAGVAEKNGGNRPNVNTVCLGSGCNTWCLLLIFNVKEKEGEGEQY